MDAVIEGDSDLAEAPSSARACSPPEATGTLPRMDDPTEVVVADEVAGGAGEAADDVEEELLVEEISIDGMCGVY